MPLELIISADADDDLTAIYRWSVNQFGDAVAADYLLAIDQALEILRDFPRSGHLHPHTAVPVRVFECRSHRIFYDADDRSITVVRVLHKARSVERNLGVTPKRTR